MLCVIVHVSCRFVCNELKHQLKHAFESFSQKLPRHQSWHKDATDKLFLVVCPDADVACPLFLETFTLPDQPLHAQVKLHGLIDPLKQAMQASRRRRANRPGARQAAGHRARHHIRPRRLGVVLRDVQLRTSSICGHSLKSSQLRPTSAVHEIFSNNCLQRCGPSLQSTFMTAHSCMLYLAT